MINYNIYDAISSKKLSAGNVTPIIGVVQLVATLVNGESVKLKVDPITGALVTEDHAVYSAINGYGIHRWVHDKNTLDASPTVLTDGPSGDQPGIYYNLASNDIIALTQFCIQLNTVSDSVDWEVGWTDDVNGAGTFTPVTAQLHLYTGTVNSGSQLDRVYPIPANIIRYSDGARSITFRVQTNDAGATINAIWHGYVIKL